MEISEPSDLFRVRDGQIVDVAVGGKGEERISRTSCILSIEAQ